MLHRNNLIIFVCVTISLFTALYILLVSKYLEQEGVKTSTTRKQNDEDLNLQNSSSTLSIGGTISNTSITTMLDENDDSKWWIGTSQVKNMSHPHMGARHYNGTIGMIVDPSPNRLRAFQLDDVDREVICPNADKDADADADRAGVEGKGGHKVLQRIRSGIKRSQDFMKKQQQMVDEGKFSAKDSNVTRQSRSKILCMVYTVYLPGDEHKNLKAQAGTWARQCDGFIAASNFTDHSVGAIDLLHLGPEEYGNMWQKTRSMLAYAHDNYREDYDFFYMGGDDIFVAVDNLRAHLDGPEVLKLENGYVDIIALHLSKSVGTTTENLRPRPLLFGSPMQWKGCLFPSGGSGYTLNRAALDMFVVEGLTSFLPNATDSREDVFIGSYFCTKGVFVSDSRDANNGTRYAGSGESSFNFDGKRSVINPKALRSKYGIWYNIGIDFASDQQIGFHLKDDKTSLQILNHTISDSLYRYFTFVHGMSDDLCVEH